MKYLLPFFIVIHLCSCTQKSTSLSQSQTEINSEVSLFISFNANTKSDKLGFYWRDDNGNILGNSKKLKEYVSSKGEELLFATNGGMYLKNQSPQGLFIENNKVKKKIDRTQKNYGNFYMQPNGVFYINNSKVASICKTSDFFKSTEVKFATQSGPMLVIDGKLHSKFQKKSQSKFVRNGVGILPNGDVLFVMSKHTINFYDFANFFKSKGCENALYLDGFVSRTYLPSKKWIQEDGDFGVMIGVTKTLN